MGALNKYNAREPKYREDKAKLLVNGKKIYDGREMIINAFKSKIFPIIPSGFDSDEDEIPKMSPNEDELSKQYDEPHKKISNIDQKLDRELIRKYIKKESSSKLFEFLRYSQNKTIDGSKQGLIEVNLSDLKKDIRNVSDEEGKRKNLDLIAYLIEKILDTIKKINNQEEKPEHYRYA